MIFVLVCAHGKDHLQILVQPIAITVVATQLTLLLPPAGMKMKVQKKPQGVFPISYLQNQYRKKSAKDLFQSLYPQPPWFQ